MKEHKTITPIDIAKVIPYTTVQRALRYLYGGKWIRGKEVYEKIKNTKKRHPKDAEEVIEICCVFDRDDIGGAWYSTSTNKYSMSFRKWKELSNIPFDKEVVHRYRPAELLAHFIYEITWYGLERESIKKGKDLMKTAKKIRKDYEKDKITS